MTATTAWAAGGVSNANPGFTAANFNSLAAGSTVVAATAFNWGSGDPYLDFLCTLTLGGTAVAGDYFALYMLPQNGYAGGYGNGEVSGSTAPNPSYLVGTFPVPAGSSSAVFCAFRGILLYAPSTLTKFALRNATSVALSSTASFTGNVWTYKENLNA